MTGCCIWYVQIGWTMTPKTKVQTEVWLCCWPSRIFFVTEIQHPRLTHFYYCTWNKAPHILASCISISNWDTMWLNSTVFLPELKLNSIGAVQCAHVVGFVRVTQKISDGRCYRCNILKWQTSLWEGSELNLYNLFNLLL